MKKYLPYILGAAVMLTIFVVVGCNSLNPNKPATAIDNAFLTPTNTNYVTVVVTNQVKQTNVVIQIVTQTNTVTGAVTSTPTTNYVITQTPVVGTATSTNVQYAPNSTITGVVGTASGFFGPIGQAVGAGIIGLLTLFAGIKSKQASTAQSVATNGVQAIETARNLISTLSPSIAAQYNTWLVQHQADANILQEVTSLVNATVNTSSGTSAGIGAASQIIQAATAPLPVTTTVPITPVPAAPAKTV